MRDIKRIKPFLEKLEKAWNFSPDLRFGQLLINMRLVEDTCETWYAEEGQLEAKIDEWIGDKDE